MKSRLIIILLVFALLLLPTGCKSGNTGSGESSDSPIKISNPREDEPITQDEALYLVRADYGDTEETTGYTYNFTYRGTNSHGTVQYHVFICEVTDEDGKTVGRRDDIWVAMDGSHTTTLPQLDGIEDIPEGTASHPEDTLGELDRAEEY